MVADDSQMGTHQEEATQEHDDSEKSHTDATQSQRYYQHGQVAIHPQDQSQNSSTVIGGGKQQMASAPFSHNTMTQANSHMQTQLQTYNAKDSSRQQSNEKVTPQLGYTRKDHYYQQEAHHHQMIHGQQNVPSSVESQSLDARAVEPVLIEQSSRG